MKPHERTLRRRRLRWRISLFLLIVHVLVFLMVWALAAYRAANLHFLVEFQLYANIIDYRTPMFVALYWMPVLLVHACAHFYFAGQSSVDAVEREAYREGLRDGARLSSNDQPNLHRLAIDDDGELVEWEFEGKRKRE